MRRSPTPSGRAGGRGFWTVERVAELARLWGLGVVGSEIADRLGTTKDAVISKAHRLELDARLPEAPPERQPGRLERRLAALAAATGTSVEALLLLQSRHRPLPRGRAIFATCQYIEGDLKTSGRHCGAPTVRHADGWPYCARHLERCRQRQKDRAATTRDGCERAGRQAA